MSEEVSEHKAMRGIDYPVPSPEEEQNPLFQLLLRVLGQTPRPQQVEHWEARLKNKPGVQQFVTQLMRSPPVQSTKFVRTKNPPGHFFSPVVDPDLVSEYVETNRSAGHHDLGGIDFHLDDMVTFWNRNKEVIASTPFPETPDPAFRYNFTGGPYSYGDATTLRAMIADLKPKRIVEIGSGYSTAVMLDAAENLNLDDLKITCIEPYADRLRSIMREGDGGRLTLIEEEVQGQPKELFATLEANDILFIDSTHVMKTGSDVHFELFSILPVLAPGVVVHFHDCRFPLEYSDVQIFQKNYSWNEVYAVRSLLMYSSRFRVIFSGSLFAQEYRDLVSETYPNYLKNPGSALWLRVMDDGSDQFGNPHFDARSKVSPVKRPNVAKADNSPAAAPVPVPGEGLVLKPKADDPDHQIASAMIGTVPVSFDVRINGMGPVFFSMGIRKSGSTLLHKITGFMARQNAVTLIDVPGTFFTAGLTAKDWTQGLDLEPLIKPQNMLAGFRSFPSKLQHSPAFASAKKVFMFRSPLDALVSQYFSDAYSHTLPDKNEEVNGRERFLKKREEARNSDINQWVLQHAASFQDTMMAYVPILGDDNCLVLRYEYMIFHKERAVDDILAHFGWKLSTEAKASLLKSVDIIPEVENKENFVRKAVPGDHKNKLSTETISELNHILKPALSAFGYIE
ncbi:MAG: putative O-methyltransferase YrrM [Paracoccaceae bacterium]|jgi:predicted O-methyltransferase YrrM